MDNTASIAVSFETGSAQFVKFVRLAHVGLKLG